ncbi:CoA-transferase, partial [Clostridium homopropionicum]
MGIYGIYMGYMVCNYVYWILSFTRTFTVNQINYGSTSYKSIFAKAVERMEKIKNIEEVLEYAKDNMSIMIGGFLGVGTPETLINGLIKK